MDNNDPKDWARCGRNLLNVIDKQTISIERSEIRLVLPFKDTYF